MLLVSESCNLRCSYCYEHHKNSKKMTFDTAKVIIDNCLKDNRNESPVIIEVFGGEAFTNFKLIREIDEYLEKKYGHLDIKYETTTNGTLVHGEIKKWLRKRREKFLISLSLDGTKQMHNMNRKCVAGEGSFDHIDIDFFAKTWPGCPAKMTVSEETLPNLAEGIFFINKLGFKCDATLSIGVSWNRDKYIPVLIEQMNILVDYYTKNYDVQLCTMLNQDLRLVFTPIDADYRFCGAGVDMTCFDTEGRAYPCQGFAPVSIGEEAVNFLEFDEKQFRFDEDNSCKKCPLVRLCPNCYAANLQSTGNIQCVDPNLCEFYKICILASAKIQCNRILQKKELTRNDQLVLKAATYVQNLLLI